MPYKLSPFTNNKEDNTAIYDWLKMLLNCYNMMVLYQNYSEIKKKKAEAIGKDKAEDISFIKTPKEAIDCSIKFISQNIGDIMIVLL